MKGYKGFDKDLKCRDFQYEVGKTYETDEAKLCEKGFHFCEAPLNVFNYHSPADSRFCEVEAKDVSDEKGDDSKRVSKKLTVGAEIGIPGVVKAHVEYVLNNCREANAASGFQSAATNTGDRSAATVATVGSVAVVIGKDSKARAGIGSAIVVCERGEWTGRDYPLLNIKAAIIDGETLKADTWYTLRNGEFVEVDE